MSGFTVNLFQKGDALVLNIFSIKYLTPKPFSKDHIFGQKAHQFWR